VLWELGLKSGSSGFVFGVVVGIIFFGALFAWYVGGREGAREYTEIVEDED
jgi:hypothetical protein